MLHFGLRTLCLVTSFFLSIIQLAAFNGTILSRAPLDWQADSVLAARIMPEGEVLPQFAWLTDLTLERITYESDSLEVVGYLVKPAKEGNYPCIIYNRGGNREFGKLTPRKAVYTIGRLAAEGYIVVASQYRGNDGGEGQEEFGGAEVNDVLNLIPLLAHETSADTSRLGMYGWSRGGMMTYLALMQDDRFDAAVVGGGASDMHMVAATRTDGFETVFRKNIPNYSQDPKAALDRRSAITRVDEIPKTTPFLILHGTADWRVNPQMALDLSQAFLVHNIPHRLMLFEGGDHGLREFREEANAQTFAWFERYLKNQEPLPELHPHGP